MSKRSKTPEAQKPGGLRKLGNDEYNITTKQKKKAIKNRGGEQVKGEDWWKTDWLTVRGLQLMSPRPRKRQTWIYRAFSLSRNANFRETRGIVGLSGSFGADGDWGQGGTNDPEAPTQSAKGKAICKHFVDTPLHMFSIRRFRVHILSPMCRSGSEGRGDSCCAFVLPSLWGVQSSYSRVP